MSEVVRSEPARMTKTSIANEHERCNIPQDPLASSCVSVAALSRPTIVHVHPTFDMVDSCITHCAR